MDGGSETGQHIETIHIHLTGIGLSTHHVGSENEYKNLNERLVLSWQLIVLILGNL